MDSHACTACSSSLAVTQASRCCPGSSLSLPLSASASASATPGAVPMRKTTTHIKGNVLGGIKESRPPQMGSGREYDIWIDGHVFLLDEATLANRVLLAFDRRVLLLDPSTRRTLRRTERRRHYAELDGADLEFQLKDDVSGRRVLIASTYNYLQWAERHDDGTDSPFVNFPNHPVGTQQQLVFGRTYVFRNVTMESIPGPDGDWTRPTMPLRVTDGTEDDKRPPGDKRLPGLDRLDRPEREYATATHGQLPPELRVLLGRLGRVAAAQKLPSTWSGSI